MPIHCFCSKFSTWFCLSGAIFSSCKLSEKCSTAVPESTAEMITNTAGFQNRCVGVCTRVCVCVRACARGCVHTHMHLIWGTSLRRRSWKGGFRHFATPLNANTRNLEKCDFCPLSWVMIYQQYFFQSRIGKTFHFLGNIGEKVTKITAHSYVLLPWKCLFILYYK